MGEPRPKRRKIIESTPHVGGKYDRPGVYVKLSCGHEHFIVKYDFWKVPKTTICGRCTYPPPPDVEKIEKEAREAAKRDIRRHEGWWRSKKEWEAKKSP